MTQKRIPLDTIAFDAGTQVRSGIADAVVSDYAERMEAGDVFPPVVLFFDSAHYYLADGFHRAMAAKRIGLTEIPADVRLGTKDDALWFALGANKANGNRLTDADKRRAIELALKTWPSRSATQIAQQVGCTDAYVGRIRSEVHTSMNLPDRVTGKDGKSYPATRKPAPAPAPIEYVADADAAAAGHAVIDQRRDLMERLSDMPRSTRHQSVPPPSNGLQFARIALMKLSEIRDNDTERREAFALVRRWLDEREAEVAVHA